MTSGLSPIGVRNPLQLYGLYLVLVEGSLTAGLFATQGVEHWTRYFLMAVMAIGLLIYVLVASFMVVYLVVKKPGFLFNPSDYDKDVQPLLFGAPSVVIQPDAPPANQQPQG